MKTVLIIMAVMAGLLMIVFIPWLVGGTIAVIICFKNGWHVAGVIIGLIAIFGQITTGSSIWGDGDSYTDSFADSYDDGFGMPELYVAYKYGESRSEKKDDQ